MKTTKWFGLVALLALPSLSGLAQAPEAPPPGVPERALVEVPATLSPGAAEVVKLASSGVGDEVVLAYIKNSQAAFNLSADDVLYLKDLGLSPEVTSAMLNHDSTLRGQPQQYAPAAASPAPAAPAAVAPAPTAPPAPTVAAAPAPVYVSSPPPDVTYFYNDLAPYGTWVQLDGYGWCWQPTAVVLRRGWRPYCDGGHWIYSDYGWYWQSSYSWGWAPFHYGRWHMHARCGWVWMPDRVWGPAWVTWRSGADCYGWAPLPPHSTFDLHLGWRYNGVSVGASFGFGLGSDAFLFVSFGDFHHRDLHRRCLPPARVQNIYNQTTIINNYVVHNNRIEHRGIPYDRVSSATRGRVPRATVRDWSDRPERMPTRASSVVYRPRLEVPARPARMEAQRVDAQNPVIRHALRAPAKTERVASSSRGGAAAGRTSLGSPKTSPWSSNVKAAPSQQAQATPSAMKSAPATRPDNARTTSDWSRSARPASAPQTTPAAPAGRAPQTSNWSRDSRPASSSQVNSAPSAASMAPVTSSAQAPRSASVSREARPTPAPQVQSAPRPTQAVPTIPPAVTAPRAPENWKQGIRTAPGYRSDSGLPALNNARMAAQPRTTTRPSTAPSASSHVYQPKSQLQTAPVRSAPPTQPRPDSSRSSSSRSGTSRPGNKP
ncbi:MAG TPA: hypothetical protein P5205_03395 [Candidatus Paceibacterota bacterium]|nr:hypothetical protein [Verrucomicrobiota bacterium]HSA09395.1 hypothetical protein [Candidatus Paceibacterota bacterium]